ncbi:SMC family ATPase [bacterium CPR1]|nr:SMC family ATPase [bacterium CPR1]
MRPLKLTLENLRSYRARQEISFEDLGLFAITGSTGAGKSSLLEALVYALYGSCTFDGRSVKALISDGPGDPTMTVSLEFEARGQRWRVDRSCSEKGRNPVHCLRRLDGEGAFDGQADVDRQIRDLVGLDMSQFLKTVVLPQGRFQQLLTAGEKDRSDVLKSLLGLDDLSRVAETVQARSRKLSDLLIRARTQREALGPDPAATVAGAREALEAARQQEAASNEQLESCREVVAALALRQTELQGVHGRIQRAEQLAQSFEDDLTALDQLEQELVRERQEAEQALLESETERARLQDVKTARESSGRTRARINQWLASARLLSELKPQLERGQQELEQRRQEQLRSQADLDELQLRSAEQPERREQLVEAGQKARLALDQAREQAEQASLWLERWRQAGGRLDELGRKLESERRTLNDECGLLSSMEASHRKAQDELAASRATRARLEQEQAVAALAAHCKPEDPCPVCARPLPEGFQAPRGEGLEEAIAAVAACESRQQVAFQTWQGAVARSQALSTQVARREAEELQARQQVEELTARGRELLGGETDFEQFDECLLAGPRQRRELAEAAYEACRAEYTAFDGECKKLEATIAERQKALSALSVELTRRAEELAELTRRCAGAESDLGEQQAAEIERELVELEKLEGQLGAALAEAHRLAQSQNQLHHRTQVELEQPRRALENAMNEQRVQLAGLGVTVEVASEPLETARRQEAARLAALERWRDEEQQGAARLQSERGVLQQRLTELGAASMDELEKRGREGETGRVLAERALAEALDKEQRAATLDQALLPAERLARNLDFIQQTLGNRKHKKHPPFSQWLQERRQQELLELASTRLLEMTGQQFGFSPRFEIVDRGTGQARKPETLSGGETFLASLSLALALSELVGRKGGRLEAFFLDEGFGSLSPECLDRALDALENLAGSGRLIGVISHVGAVAERLERILRVSRTPQGSVVEEVSGSARDEAARSDLDPARLAALSAG